MAEFNRYYFDMQPFKDDEGWIEGFSLTTEFYDMDCDITFLVYLNGDVEMLVNGNVLTGVNLPKQIALLGLDIVREKKKRKR